MQKPGNDRGTLARSSLLGSGQTNTDELKHIVARSDRLHRCPLALRIKIDVDDTDQPFPRIHPGNASRRCRGEELARFENSRIRGDRTTFAIMISEIFLPAELSRSRRVGTLHEPHRLVDDVSRLSGREAGSAHVLECLIDTQFG